MSRLGNLLDIVEVPLDRTVGERATESVPNVALVGHRRDNELRRQMNIAREAERAAHARELRAPILTARILPAVRRGDTAAVQGLMARGADIRSIEPELLRRTATHARMIALLNDLGIPTTYARLGR